MPVSKTRERGAAQAAKPTPQKLLLPGEYEAMQRAEAARHFVLPVGTDWVERDVFNVSDEINARWPNLRVASCSCGRCLTAGHYPHVVLEYCKDGQTRPVFGFTRFGPEIVQRLHHIANADDVRAAHEKHNAALERDRKRREAEAHAERMDVIHSALKSHKTTYTGPNGLRTSPHTRIVS